ncbi:caspase family protein [Candidatus Viadribacter manganicus]|uniref:OmpA-like domain-containing protein n=1 Tax=Candidatus Viadribacter manganicus TaxID=1759059 RepID=A0A1B1AGM2_9PROT|nr:caspase family protein [Candidatus Viadribacter manganicus]ANP45691.1 hypothetical protein ATE48_07025 [Candidatus Viadribacter manganicus]
MMTRAPGLLLMLLTLLFAAPSAARPLAVDVNGAPRVLYQERHALLISAAHYEHAETWPALSEIPNDTARLEVALMAQGYEVETLPDPHSEQLLVRMQAFMARYGSPDSAILIVYSGHGWTDPATQLGYIVPVNAPDPASDRSGFLASAVSLNMVRALASESRAKHTLFVFDSCFSGSIFTTRSHNGAPSPRQRDVAAFTRLSQPTVQILTSGSANERVPGHSIFMDAFISAVGGNSQPDIDADGVLTFDEIEFWFRHVVQLPNQTPQSGFLTSFTNDGQFVLRSSALAPGETAETADDEFWDSLVDGPITSASARQYLAYFPLGAHAAQAQYFLQRPQTPIILEGVAAGTNQPCSGVRREGVVYFAWNRTNLSAEAATTLDDFRQHADATEWIVVNGHTDTLAADQFSMDLSRRAAITVSDYLSANGFARGLLTTIASGELSPARPTADGVREPLNRRVTITACVRN